MRTCTRCLQTLPATNFYVRTDGRPRAECKVCWKLRSRPATKLWSTRHPDRCAEKARKFRRLHPEAMSRPVHPSHRAVDKALRKGVLSRPAECGRCLRKCSPVAHHPDYAKPLDVIWLCRSCHYKAHQDGAK